MNMLIGVLCEVVSAVAATEKEEMLVTYVHQKLAKVVSVLDTDGGGTISKTEFMKILENAEAVRCLQDVGVDVIGLVDFADFIFSDTGSSGEDGQEDEVELDFPKFMDVVLQLRGSNNATVKDIVDLRKFVQNQFDMHKKAILQEVQATNRVLGIRQEDRRTKQSTTGRLDDSGKPVKACSARWNGQAEDDEYCRICSNHSGLDDHDIELPPKVKDKLDFSTVILEQVMDPKFLLEKFPDPELVSFPPDFVSGNGLVGNHHDEATLRGPWQAVGDSDQWRTYSRHPPGGANNVGMVPPSNISRQQHQNGQHVKQNGALSSPQSDRSDRRRPDADMDVHDAKAHSRIDDVGLIPPWKSDTAYASEGYRHELPDIPDSDDKGKAVDLSTRRLLRNAPPDGINNSR